MPSPGSSNPDVLPGMRSTFGCPLPHLASETALPANRFTVICALCGGPDRMLSDPAVARGAELAGMLAEARAILALTLVRDPGERLQVS
jgi:hypothetical protein